MPTSGSDTSAPIVPSDALPPAVPFTYQVIVVVVVLLLELLSVTCAVNSVCTLMGTLTVVGLIASAVTWTAPLPPPHADMPAKQAIVSARTNQFAAFFRITGLPFGRSTLYRRAARFSGSVLERFLESPISNSREPIANYDVCSFPSVCSLSQIRRGAHAWIPVFPRRKKKFQFLEVLTRRSVAPKLFMPRA